MGQRTKTERESQEKQKKPKTVESKVLKTVYKDCRSPAAHSPSNLLTPTYAFPFFKASPEERPCFIPI